MVQCLIRNLAAATAILIGAVLPLAAQVTPAAGNAPPNDTPSFKVGATIIAYYTYNQSPESVDADGNVVNNSSFNITRAYLNLTGQVNHWILFRITPDVARESGTGSSLNGSQNFRLKYAFAQFNLDDWMTHGSWARFGVQQTPLVDYTEGIYRYRWQGTIFVEREGYLTSSDAGASFHYNFAGNYGDLHVGYYNGDGYSRSETNDQKAVQLRATVRPLPLGGIWKGLRATLFVDEDHYVANAKRQRLVEQVTFESTHINAGFDHINAKDQTSKTKSELEGDGWSVWANPHLTKGWELLFRHDDIQPSKTSSGSRKRDIAGVSYWFPIQAKGVTTALMLDYDSLKPVTGAKDTRYGVKLFLNF
jgi:hypothetical protein